MGRNLTVKALDREPAGMSDEGRTEPDARPADTRPLTDDGHSVLFTMAAMLSLEDDMRVVSSLNERLTPMEGSRDAELGEGQEARAAQAATTPPLLADDEQRGEVVRPP